jgi:hypothetical protein
MRSNILTLNVDKTDYLPTEGARITHQPLVLCGFVNDSVPAVPATTG